MSEDLNSRVLSPEWSERGVAVCKPGEETPMSSLVVSVLLRVQHLSG